MSNSYTSISKIEVPTRLVHPQQHASERSPVLTGAGVAGVNGKFHRVPGKLVNEAPYFRNAAGFEISLAKGQKFWAILGPDGGAFYFAPADAEDIFTPPVKWTPHTLAYGKAAPILHLELEQEAGQTNALTPRDGEVPLLEPAVPLRQSSTTSAATSPSPSAICKMNFMNNSSVRTTFQQVRTGPLDKLEAAAVATQRVNPSGMPEPERSAQRLQRRSSDEIPAPARLLERNASGPAPLYSNNDSPLLNPQSSQSIPRQAAAQPVARAAAQPVAQALQGLPVQAGAPSHIGQVFAHVGDYKPPGAGHMATRVSPQVLPSSFSPALPASYPTQPYGLPPLPNVTYSPHSRRPNPNQAYYQWHHTPYLPPPQVQHTPARPIQQGGAGNNVFYMVQPVMAPKSLFNAPVPAAAPQPKMGLAPGLANPLSGSILAQMNGGLFAPPPQRVDPVQHPVQRRPQAVPTQLPTEAVVAQQLPSTSASRTSPELVEAGDERPQSRQAVSELGGEPIQEAEPRPRTASSAVIAPPVQDPAEVLPKYYRVTVSQGVTYRMTQNLQDKFEGQVAKHDSVVEAEVQDQDFIRCSNGLWLPKRIGKHELLVPVDDEMDYFQVLVQPGISFRRSMDMDDKSKRDFAKFGDRIAVHRMEGDWVAIPGGLYLPLRLKEGEKVTQLLEKLEVQSEHNARYTCEERVGEAARNARQASEAEMGKILTVQRTDSSKFSVYSG